MKPPIFLPPDWRHLLVKVGAFNLALPREQVAGVSRLHPLLLLPQFSAIAHPPIHLGAGLVSLRPQFDQPDWIGPDSSVVYVPAPGATPVSPCVGLIVDALPRALCLGETHPVRLAPDQPCAHAIVAQARLNGRPVQIVDVRALLPIEMAKAG